MGRYDIINKKTIRINRKERFITLKIDQIIRIICQLKWLTVDPVCTRRIVIRFRPYKSCWSVANFLTFRRTSSFKWEKIAKTSLIINICRNRLKLIVIIRVRRRKWILLIAFRTELRLATIIDEKDGKYEQLFWFWWLILWRMINSVILIVIFTYLSHLKV